MKEKFGLKISELDLLYRLVIDPLKQKGAKVFIFGSRATGKHKKFSDVDILIDCGSKNIPLNVLSEIKENIEESNFPYKVDIVALEELATSYKSQVVAEKLEV